MTSFYLPFNSSIPSLGHRYYDPLHALLLSSLLKISRSHVHVFAHDKGVLPHTVYTHVFVTSLLESDWRAPYSAQGHRPYMHLTRPLLAFCIRGVWRARLN